MPMSGISAGKVAVIELAFALAVAVAYSERNPASQSEEQGNQREAQRLGARLRALQRSRPQLPASWTGREVEVLRLVATGKSNRQFASDLVLSKKTINRLGDLPCPRDRERRLAWQD